MYFVYVIHSTLHNRFYIGSTANIETRLAKHNSGATRSTKPFRPWVLVCYESFETRTEARKRENQIKKYKGGEAFKSLLRKFTPS
ncbi:GIY-YIG nuclease family protein [Patescibacteria group bacterium]|nr:GIY-YIG nuclease family protein [Patescibacteria group bacterium]